MGLPIHPTAGRQRRATGGVRRTMRLLIAVIASSTAGCSLFRKSPTTPTTASEDGPSSYVYVYHHNSQQIEVSAQVGLWMHRERTFTRAAIADWLDVPYEGKVLLEPINVLWLDPWVENEGDARDNVVGFLGACRFRREGDAVFGSIPRHSSGYYASYGSDIWREQYDPDDAWVSGLLGSEFRNLHGRIFPAHEVAAADGRRVFLTSGAFSQEGGPLTVGCLGNTADCHEFLSFDRARDALNCGVEKWSAFAPQNFGNAYPLSLGLSFSTADHNGVRVFEHQR
jgi:hypothetical protein